MDINKVAMVLDWAQARDQNYPAAFKEMGIAYVKQQCDTDQDILTLASDADCIMTIGNIRSISPEVVEKLDRCKLIQTISVGFDGIPVQLATECAICVANVPGYCREEVSDHVMSLILGWSRRIIESDRLIRAGRAYSGDKRTLEFRQLASKMHRLRGVTLGLIGLGKVATTLVPKARGFGMRILTYDPYISGSLVEELAIEAVSLDQLLRESDFVSIHCSLTPETRHLIGLDQLKKMKPSAFLINTARGGIVDTEAIYVALTEGYIAGAGLDAIDPDPPSPNHPLLSLNNVILTGHTAFAGPEAEAEQWRRPLEEVARMKRGEWPLSLVNPQVKDRFVQKWGKMR